VLFSWSTAASPKANPKGVTQAARLGRAFKLRAGQQVTLKGKSLRIKFAAVEEDSRCPADVKCVWAGNAAVRLDVRTNRRDGKSLTLNTSDRSSSGDEARYEGYKFKLMDLSPYPQSDRKIMPGDYVVTLLVSKE
jgi:hypothetical protein